MPVSSRFEILPFVLQFVGSDSVVLVYALGFVCLLFPTFQYLISSFEERLSYLIENPEMIRKLGNNARIYSRFFTTEEIIRKLMIFIGGLNDYFL